MDKSYPQFDIVAKAFSSLLERVRNRKRFAMFYVNPHLNEKTNWKMATKVNSATKPPQIFIAIPSFFSFAGGSFSFFKI